MAKKIKITGDHLLHTINDDWGGVNNTGEDIQIHGITVPAGVEWGMNRGEVERFIKAQLASKSGYMRIPREKSENGFYFIQGFASQAAAALYDEDQEEHADLLLFTVEIPISTEQDSYGAYLFTTLEPSADIVVAEPTLNVNFRFHAVKVTNGERLNMGSKGTLTIQRSLDNGNTWESYTLANAINSTDYSNTETYTQINLGPYLSKEYSQLVRVRASFRYVDENDEEKTANSTWVQIGNTVTYTQLSLTCLQPWHTPMFAENIRVSGFPTNYMVYGAVAKTLHIQIQGAAANPLPVEYLLGVSDNGVQVVHEIPAADDSYKIFVHGVRTVTAWLTCDDGLGGELSSEVLVNRFMVIDPATAAYPDRPFLLLQNVVSRLKNYVQTKICDYAVFNPVVDGESIVPGTDPVNVQFFMTSYSTTFPNDPNVTEYFAFESLVVPGVRHSLTTTIEVESESTDDINSYFRVWRKDDEDVMHNFMLESMNASNINIVVDNSDSFAPTLGATFVLNPKVRNNSESNPARILNSQANNAEIPSTFQGFDFVNDGWVTAEDGTKVLRVLAGERLNIQLNPFAQFLLTPDSSMTMEFDMNVRNVTNEDDPIISLFETIQAGITTNYRGLIIRPMEGNIYTKTNTIDSETNFRWCEEKRTHISININNAVVPTVNGDGLYDPDRFTPAQSIALVRVFVNGNIEREMKFSLTNADEFCTADMSNGGITIGQDGADIDIYSIRCYLNRQLNSQAIVKNWIATLPTADEKLRIRRENDILTGGRVDVEKVKALGKRVLILHGAEPYFYNTSVAKVWWEIFQYDENGEYIPELSGTICRQTGTKPKRQGSTANTYYYSNIQTKVDDGGSITIPIAQIHESITVGEPYEMEYEEDGQTLTKTVVDIYGGNLGAYDPVRAQAKQYDYNNGMVTVPDGWIDGNGKYRGMGFMIAEGTPLATKLVLKVNYASSMQSHLCGGNRLYNDLHTAVVGKNSLQQAVPSARVSKYTEPVFFFTQADGSNEVVFRGGGNFGAGKMDKPTWGYVKKLHPKFAMIEGSDNNYPLTDMRVPFTTDPNCPEYVSYSVGDEGYFYNGLQCLDFDAGKTDDNEVPVADIRDRLANAWNFLYMHSPMVKFYPGSFEQFVLSEEALKTNYKWWCTDGPDAYLLKRYDFVGSRWVNAGLWNSANQEFEAIDLRTDEITGATYQASLNHAEYDLLNNELVGAIVAHAKKYIGWYFKVSSLQFHYAFQNHFMAGTDNCSKNTYFVVDPTAKSVTIDGETRECYLFELHQDDVDTILITDNNGRSTKPYYIDRMHPFDDKDSGQTTSCYEGTNNVLFNLMEAMFEATGELQSMMKAIFTAMVDLITTADNAKGYTNSIWGCLNKYLFSIQRYFPVTAYNEQARIRYEWPALLGFVSQGSGARNIAPITQSMGNQLEAETQFMIRRVIYMASYAAWGNFYDAGKTHSVGIADAADTFSLQAFHLPNQSTSNNNYSFVLTPHQYIYPTGMLGQTSIDPHVRVAPGQQFTLNLGSTESNDTGMSVLGVNYYRSVGNVGDLSVSPNVTFEVKGKRLVEFVAEPTITYVDGDTGRTVGAFRPNQLNITAKGLQHVSLNGSGIGGTSDITALTRLGSLDIRGTYIYDIDMPASENLTEIHLPASLIKLHIANLPRLVTCDIEGYDAMTSVKVGDNVGALNTKGLVMGLYDAKVTNATESTQTLTTLQVNNVDWTNFPIEILSWMSDLQVITLNGTIGIEEPDATQNAVTFALKDKFNRKWGNVDDETSAEHQGLKLTYRQRQLDSLTARGNFYPEAGDTFPFTAVPNSVYVNGFTKIRYSLSEEAGYLQNSRASIDPITGVLTVESLSNSIDRAKVIITVTTYFAGQYGVMVAEKEIDIYNRKAALGDFVYHDGTYSSPDTYDGEKQVIGVCCWIAPQDAQGNIITDLANPDDKQKRLMCALRDASASGTGSAGNSLTLSEWQWGSYYNTGGATNDIYDFTDSHAKLEVPEALLTQTTFYDLPTIVNLTTSGMPSTSINNANMRDEISTLGVQNHGFVPFTPGQSGGDGVIGGTTPNGTYTETESQLNARTLTAELAALAGNGYHEGDIVNSGYAKTLKMIQHRNKILNNGVVLYPAEGDVQERRLGPLPIPTAISGRTELENLVSLIATLRNYMATEYQDANSAKWSQIYYPAASAAYAYEPTVVGFELADKFKAHNWFLPANGLLMRFCWYRSKGTGSSQNIFKKAIDKQIFTNFSASYFWSSTEYISTYAWYCSFSSYNTYGSTKSYGFRVRPVAAF